MLRICRLPNYPGYGVSSDGRVWSCRQTGNRPLSNTWHELSYTNNKGYLMVGLYKDKLQKWYLVHRLMAHVFLGMTLVSIDRQTQVNHKNGNKLDNAWENLEIVSAQQNIQHAWRTGLSAVHMVGSKHVNSKLCESQVLSIRQRYAQGGISQESLGVEFGVCQQVIWDIVNMKTWKHVKT